MTGLRVPLATLQRTMLEFQRASNALLDLETRLKLQLHQFESKALSEAGLDDDKVRTVAEERTLSDGVRELARMLRVYAEGFQEADRRAAARVPNLPLPRFTLPLAAPRNRPWPFPAVPASTIIARRIESPASAGDTDDGLP